VSSCSGELPCVLWWLPRLFTVCGWQDPALTHALEHPPSDILTPLAAVGVPFDIDDAKGPLIEEPVRSLEQVRLLVARLCMALSRHDPTPLTWRPCAGGQAARGGPGPADLCGRVALTPASGGQRSGAPGALSLFGERLEPG